VTERPRVDVGIVTWNSASLTAEAVRRLLQDDQGADLHLLVWDNASEDGTPEAIRAVAPTAEVFESPVNLGFASAVNRLLARSDAPWFLALNSDAWPEPGAVGRLVAAARQHPAAAAVAPALVRPDGATEHSTHPFPSLGLAAVDALGLRAVLPRRWAAERCLEGAWDHDRPRPVDWAVGAALLLRRSAVRHVGAFDERYFFYVEDLEWCHRARRAGWEILFEPAATVRHVGGVSGSRRFGDQRAALEQANLNRFLPEALGRRRAMWYRALVEVGVARRYGWARLTGRHGEAAHWRARLRALLGLVPPPGVWDPGTRPALFESAGGAAPGTAAGGGGTPEVAVVVATRNRAGLLPRLISALERQSLPPSCFEVLVVDDGSTDATAALLEETARHSPLRLRVLRTPQRVGPAAARNLGWRATEAAVVAFTDDDCVPDPKWLEAGSSALGAGPRIVVGRTEPPADQLERCGRPFARVIEVSQARFFETCNVFYLRHHLEAVGGFDERFRRPSGEDTHLGLRVSELGVPAVFADDAVVRHDVRPGGALAALVEASRWVDLPLVLKGRAYARAGRAHRRVFWKRSHPPAILAAAGLLLARRWRWAPALALAWVWYRLRRDPVCADPVRRVAMLPAALAVDLTEVGTMVRGSIRHRTVLL
jgi:GT2 family glycosyltransferase